MTRQQVSTTVSEMTRQKAEWLMDNAGYSLRSIVEVGVEKVYQETVEMTRADVFNKIGKVEFIFGDLFYEGDWTGVHEDASETRYMELVAEAIDAYFNGKRDPMLPETEVDVTTSRVGEDSVKLYSWNGDRMDPDNVVEYGRKLEHIWRDVQEIGGDVFNGQQWIVMKDNESKTNQVTTLEWFEDYEKAEAHARENDLPLWDTKSTPGPAKYRYAVGHLTIEEEEDPANQDWVELV